MTNCDICQQKGIVTEASYDAPTPMGPWAYLCDACFYRLPKPLKRLATKLTK